MATDTLGRPYVAYYDYTDHKLVFATLWRASQRWRGVRFTAMERQQLEAYLRIRRAAGAKVRELAA